MDDLQGRFEAGEINFDEVIKLAQELEDIESATVNSIAFTVISEFEGLDIEGYVITLSYSSITQKSKVTVNSGLSGMNEHVFTTLGEGQEAFEVEREVYLKKVRDKKLGRRYE